MTTNAKASLITFGVGNGASPEVFASIAEVIGFPTLSLEQGEADATNMGSPIQGDSLQEEMIPTKVVRVGDLTINMNADMGAAAQIAIMTTDFYAGTIKSYRISFTEQARMVTFKAWIKGYEANGTIDDKSNLDVTFKITGGVTWAAIV
jgi:hypothetical protein